MQLDRNGTAYDLSGPEEAPVVALIHGSRTIIVPHLQHLGLIEEPSLFTGPLLKFLGEADEQGS